MEFCPICSSEDITIFNRRTNPKMLICRICRHVFWEKFPSEKSLEEYYRTRYTSKHDQWKIQTQNAEYYRNHLEELRSYMNTEVNNISLVDFGCSFPILLLEAKKKGFKNVIGIDFALEAQEFGKSHRIKVCNAQEFFNTEPPGEIDIIRFSHFFEHVIDPVAFLINASEKLRTNGVAYITQPSYPVFFADCLNLEIEDAAYPEHLHFFSPISLCKLLQKSGLSINILFTHNEEEKRLIKYREYIDEEYARRELGFIKGCSDPKRSSAANYPFYTGRNSVVWATLRGYIHS